MYVVRALDSGELCLQVPDVGRVKLPAEVVASVSGGQIRGWAVPCSASEAEASELG